MIQVIWTSRELSAFMLGPAFVAGEGVSGTDEKGSPTSGLRHGAPHQSHPEPGSWSRKRATK